MRAVLSLAMTACVVMIGWYGPIPSAVESAGHEPPPFLPAQPNWNAALAWAVGAVVFALRMMRARRTDRR
jgi:hypothetical protein